MKKIIVLGALASLLVLAGCSSYGTSSNQQAPATQTSAAPSHHDYKGESFNK